VVITKTLEASNAFRERGSGGVGVMSERGRGREEGMQMF